MLGSYRSICSQLVCALSAWLVMNVPSAFSYEIQTHRTLSRAAVDQSVLSRTATLANLGLRPVSSFDPSQTFPKLQGTVRTALTVRELIQFGAEWEDNLAAEQALRHFYDPLNDRPLDLSETVGTTLSIKSPNWAIEDARTYEFPAAQNFSYRDARQSFYDALTSTLSEGYRRKQFGLTFQAIGHIIHHLQDMAQPQHVRNDPHCDRDMCKRLAEVTQSSQLFSPSLFEQYTDLDHATNLSLQIRSRLPVSGPWATPVHPGTNAATSPFKLPRHFWRTTTPGSDIAQGKGIAEYTNRNFYSAASITSYPSPPPPQGMTQYYFPAETRDIAELLPGTTLNGKVRFWSSEVTDTLAGGPPVTNTRALSEGLLDSDLVQYYSTAGPGYLVYALNRFTFDAAHQFLIPRAVAYSAGLINYFFRGELEIRLPNEGVYGVVDHTIENQRNAGGFGKIKLKLRNVTPGGTDVNGQPLVEPIPEGAGSLVAVVKFHRNLCYQPDLSGEYGSPGMDWQICRSPTEEIVVSLPQSTPAGFNQQPQSMTFTFPNKVPIEATDLFLQVVYRGRLGEEEDAIAVATKDISEPRYLYNYARWDQYTYAPWPSVEQGPYSWAQWCAQGGYASLDDCNRAEGQTTKGQYSPDASPIPGYDPAAPIVPQGTWTPIAQEPPFSPVVTMPAPVGTLTRVAVLTEANPTNAGLWVVEWGASPGANRIFMWVTGVAAATRNQLDPVTGELIPSVTYLPGRGVYLPTAENYLLTDGNAATIPPLVLVPSQINF